MKRSLEAMAVLGAFLYVAPAMAEQAFTDGFEGTSLDPYWNVSANVYTLAGYSMSTEQARSGAQSLKVAYGANLSYSHAGLPALYLGHFFSNPVQGDFSVYYYDTLAPVSGGLYLDDTTTYWASLGRSYGNDFFNPDIGYYATQFAPSAAEIKVGNPSLGWHHYEIRIRDSGSRYFLDGVELVQTSPLSHPDKVYLSSLIPNNVYNPGGYVAYFDDFSFTPVPEPSTMVLTIVGGLGVFYRRRRG